MPIYEFKEVPEQKPQMSDEYFKKEVIRLLDRIGDRLVDLHILMIIAAVLFVLILLK